jgi:hypothetical protein
MGSLCNSCRLLFSFEGCADNNITGFHAHHIGKNDYANGPNFMVRSGKKSMPAWRDGVISCDVRRAAACLFTTWSTYKSTQTPTKGSRRPDGSNDRGHMADAGTINLRLACYYAPLFAID